ncbi:MAG: hypothetical protein Q8K60_02305, partial [Parachlamydiaceae bacterium]|nr:hypothetical protein [Parachlamydiaceae bacterium]
NTDNKDYFDSIIKEKRNNYKTNNNKLFNDIKNFKNDDCLDLEQLKKNIIELVKENQQIIDPNYEYIDLYYLILSLPEVTKQYHQDKDENPFYTYSIQLKQKNDYLENLLNSKEEMLVDIHDINETAIKWYGAIQEYEENCRQNEYDCFANQNNVSELIDTNESNKTLSFNKINFLDNYADKIFSINTYIDDEKINSKKRIH